MSNAPSPFSAHLPTLQVVWDSTSFKQLMFCPTSYKYTIIDGWRGATTDLEFGIFFASATEAYKKARLKGASKDDATIEALKVAFNDTWIPDDNGGHPWGGSYQETWRCTGSEPYRNSKGNKAKCPFSHKGAWFPAPGPDTCGTCGSPTERLRQWVPSDEHKNRHTLVRLVAWYCEEQPEEGQPSGLHPYAFPNGTPAVELSFKLPLPWKTEWGERYILSGHLDSIMQNGDGSETFIADNKTTKKALGKAYWDSYSPNVQVDNYDLAGNMLFPELGLKGVAIEAAQTMVGGAKFGTQVFYRNESQREEALQTIRDWITQAEGFAKANHWPMATANCWLCPFKGVCSKEPAKRQMYLESGFKRQPWNPLEER